MRLKGSAAKVSHVNICEQHYAEDWNGIWLREVVLIKLYIRS